MNTLDQVFETALRSLHQDLTEGSWIGREREIISLFTFTHLLPLCSKDGPIVEPGQIGIEVAVPQVKNGIRSKRDVCKDLVVWPRARMTCWQRGSPYPLSVVEWKAINRQDSPKARERKRREYEQDIHWLLQTSVLCSSFMGFAVFVTQRPGIEISSAKIFRGNVHRDWLVLRPTGTEKALCAKQS